MVAKYLGKAMSSTDPITDFSKSSSGQNERDDEAFLGAINSGRLPVLEGL